MAKEPKAARVLGRARSDAGRKIDDLVHSMPDDAFGAAQISSAGGAGTQRPLREPACEIPYRATSAKMPKMLRFVAFCCIGRHVAQRTSDFRRSAHEGCIMHATKNGAAHPLAARFRFICGPVAGCAQRHRISRSSHQEINARGNSDASAERHHDRRDGREVAD